MYHGNGLIRLLQEKPPPRFILIFTVYFLPPKAFFLLLRRPNQKEFYVDNVKDDYNLHYNPSRISTPPGSYRNRKFHEGRSAVSQCDFRRELETIWRHGKIHPVRARF
jgi:hypothetical protein